METKDWILLLLPIFCNGIIIFILQKIFERRQFIKNIKYEYASILRQKIDLSLELHAKATRLNNEVNVNQSDNQIIIPQYVNSVLDVYYYYIQNKVIFKKFNNNMENIGTLVLKLIECNKQKGINSMEFSVLFNRIRDELMVLKKECIELHL